MLGSRLAISAQLLMSMAALSCHHLPTTPEEDLNTHLLIITPAPSCSGLFPDSLPPTIWRAPVRLTARGNELVGGTIVSGGLPGVTDLQITVHLTIDSSSVTGFVAGENWLKIPGQLYPLLRVSAFNVTASKELNGAIRGLLGGIVTVELGAQESQWINCQSPENTFELNPLTTRQ